MIFYFSGTGNSEWIARTLAKRLQERVASIPALVKVNQWKHTLEKDEIVGFVYPVYAANPPKMVLEFIRRLSFENDEGQYRFAVCSDDQTGAALALADKALAKKGHGLDAAWAVDMPNNYLIGADVDPPEVQQQKLAAAKEKAKEIEKAIRRRQTGIFEGKRRAGFEYIVAGKLFNALMLDAKPFNVTDKCKSCGLCADNCPADVIELKDGRPIWEGECTLCLGCIHRCPQRAIEYGKGTVPKGRYYNPLMKEWEQEETAKEERQP